MCHEKMASNFVPYLLESLENYRMRVPINFSKGRIYRLFLLCLCCVLLLVLNNLVGKRPRYINIYVSDDLSIGGLVLWRSGRALCETGAIPILL